MTHLFEGPTVMLVEDDDQDVFLIHEALCSVDERLRIVVCRTGEEAVSYLQSTVPIQGRLTNPLPDLVLVDLQKLGIAGLELLRSIRKQPEFCQVIVSIYSAAPSASDVAKAYELGANLYLTKPNCFDELRRLVRALIAIRPFVRIHPSAANR